MGKADEWEQLALERKDEICRALVRIPAISYGQISRMLGIGRNRARDLVWNMWGKLEEANFNPEKHRAGQRYVAGSNRMKHLVRMDEDEQEDWERSTGIHSALKQIKVGHVGRLLLTMDILIAMYQKGMLYELWDIMMPQEEVQSLHASILNRQTGHSIGVFLLPNYYPKDTSVKTVINGIMYKLMQNIAVDEVLLLTPLKHYETTYQMVSKLKDASSFRLYLLPFESFVKEPDWFLPEIMGVSSGIDAVMGDVVEELPVPLQYEAFQKLVRLKEVGYRLIDVWTSGSIEAVTAWLDEKWRDRGIGYQIGGAMAIPRVYIYDEVMLSTITKIVDKRNYQIEVMGWPGREQTEVAKDDEGAFSHLNDLSDLGDFELDDSWIRD